MGGDSDEAGSLSIETVLIHYGATHIPGGSGWKSMRCPFRKFHQDHRASGSINRQKNKYRCHACGTAGDPIDIIRALEGMGFKEACEQAREVFGTSIQPVSQPVRQRRKRRALGSERWKDILE